MIDWPAYQPLSSTRCIYGSTIRGPSSEQALQIQHKSKGKFHGFQGIHTTSECSIREGKDKERERERGM